MFHQDFQNVLQFDVHLKHLHTEIYKTQLTFYQWKHIELFDSERHEYIVYKEKEHWLRWNIHLDYKHVCDNLQHYLHSTVTLGSD